MPDPSPGPPTGDPRDESIRSVPPPSRELWALALPALGALAAEPLMGLLDTALVGRLGAVPLAALGAATAVLNFIFSLLVFLEYGTTLRLARRVGQRRPDLVAREAVQMLWLGTGLGLLVAAIIWVGTDPLLRLVDVPADARELAVTYLTIRAVGAVPGLWIRVAHGVFRGLQDTRTPLRVVIGINLLNAVLDVALIFGVPALGVPAFGVAGAAWATVAATTVGSVGYLAVLRRRLHAHLDRGPGGLRPRWSVLREMLSMSRDLLLRTFSLMAALFMATRMAAGLGTTSLAAHQVGWQLWLFLALVLDSLAIAGQALVGRTLGEGRPDHARSVGNRLCGWAGFMGVAFAGLFLLLRGVLPAVFTDDPAVLAAVDGIFLILALMQVPNALLFALDGLLIGAADLGFLRNAMAALGAFGVLTAWLGREWGGTLAGVWLGIGAYMLARLIVMGLRWWSGGWVRDPSSDQ